MYKYPQHPCAPLILLKFSTLCPLCPPSTNPAKHLVFAREHASENMSCLLTFNSFCLVFSPPRVYKPHYTHPYASVPICTQTHIHGRTIRTSYTHPHTHKSPHTHILHAHLHTHNPHTHNSHTHTHITIRTWGGLGS